MKKMIVCITFLCLMGCEYFANEIDKIIEEMEKDEIIDISDSLVGIDSNNIGIRDDIEYYINHLNETDKVKNELKKGAKSLQHILTTTLDEKIAYQILLQNNKIGLCLFFLKDSFDLEDELIRRTFNTKKRYEQYLNYNKLLDGTTFPVDIGEHNCDS